MKLIKVGIICVMLLSFTVCRNDKVQDEIKPETTNEVKQAEGVAAGVKERFDEIMKDPTFKPIKSKLQDWYDKFVILTAELKNKSVSLSLSVYNYLKDKYTSLVAAFKSDKEAPKKMRKLFGLSNVIGLVSDIRKKVHELGKEVISDIGSHAKKTLEKVSDKVIEQAIYAYNDIRQYAEINGKELGKRIVDNVAESLQNQQSSEDSGEKDVKPNKFLF